MLSDLDSRFAAMRLPPVAARDAVRLLARRRTHRAVLIGVRANQHGQATVELALLVPLLVAVLFLIFEVGRWAGSWILITNASREGARFGVTQSFDTSADSSIMARVAATAQFLSVKQVACTGSSPPAPPSGSTSCVAISRATDSTTGDHILTVVTVYKLQTLMPITGKIPFIGAMNYPGALTVYGESDMRSEQ